jgi:hypothetical protein
VATCSRDFSFGVDTDPSFDDRAENHESSADEITDQQSGFRTGADDPAEQDWRAHAAGQGSEGVEDRDGEARISSGKISLTVRKAESATARALAGKLEPLK